MKYRADLDGLRAIAVVAVIFYHASVPGFAGGYVGVDIFFVISGYLITQVLEAPATGSRLRALTQFYVRRARRILPALFAMLVACSAIALALYLPADLRNFGRSLMLGVVFLGNYAAALAGSYFDPGQRFMPLRHLWSLGVEEQFYLLFPLYLLLIAACRDALRRMLLVAAALASLLLSYWGSIHSPVLNFFMSPTRAWELLAGAILAVTPGLFQCRRRTNQILSAVGAAGLVAVCWHARVIRFPGAATIGACVSTALLIIGNSTGTSLVARALSLRPIVFTGLISYSLYLWHAPILDFFSYFNIHEPTFVELCLLFTLIYLIAAGSWLAIEQPFRAHTPSRARRSFVPAVLAISVALAMFGYWLIRMDGLPQRWPFPLPTAAADSREIFSMAARCAAASPESIALGELCSFGPQDDAAPKVVVWGDSHASVLLPTYQSLANSDGIRIYFGIKGACWPLVGSEAASAGEFWRARCSKFNQAMVKAIQRINPQRVILNAYWLDPGAPVESGFLKRTPQAQSAIVQGIRRTLEQVQAPMRTICAVLTVPGYGFPIPYALAMTQRRHIDASTLPVSRAEALREYRTVEGALRLLASRNELGVADPKDVFCPGTRCLIQTPEGALLYRDANHVSSTGARLLTGVVEECLADLHQQ